MANRDLYNVLGVPRDASPDAIKRSYRQLAKRFHPDRNPGDPVAEARFRDVHEAYSVLSDPEQRARYDRLGPLFTSDGRPPTPDDVSDVLGRMWDNLWGRGRIEEGDDLKYTVSVTLEEVATGTEREIAVPRRVTCGTCGGYGAPKDARSVCSVCDGTGRSKGPRLLRSTCYHCGGQGYTVDTPCADCGGEGLVDRTDALKVKIPAGVATGQKLKLAGRGHDAPRGGHAGDLYVVVNVAEHPLFRRRGDDVLVDVPVPVTDAMLGADVPVPTLQGRTVIRVPAGTHHGRRFRLAGRGLPRRGRGGHGDLHLQITLEVPRDLTDDEARRLRDWAEALGDDRHPEHAAFRAAVEDR